MAVAAHICGAISTPRSGGIIALCGMSFIVLGESGSGDHPSNVDFFCVCITAGRICPDLKLKLSLPKLWVLHVLGMGLQED